MKNTKNSKQFVAGLNSLKAFMNEKEEIMSQINDNIAAEFEFINFLMEELIIFRECQEFLRNILKFLQENMKNGTFEKEDKSVLEEISKFLYEFFYKFFKII